MVEREFDIIVFGASGFTGQVIVAESVKHLKPDGSFVYRVAAAGRNYPRIANALDDIGAQVGYSKKLSEAIPILLADSENPDSLLQLCRRARLVINCVGPFRFYGEAVVRACVIAGTDYVDICGEPQFIESMQYKYHEDAKANDCIIISSCGFDSIPADIGVIATADILSKKATPSTIESFLSLKAGPAGSSAHYTTWESAIHGFGDHGQLTRLRRTQPIIKVPTIGQRLQRHEGPFFENRVARWSLPFPGADAAVVGRTQQLLVATNSTDAHPVQYAAYFTLSSFKYLAVTMLIGGMFKMFSSFSFGRKLLLKYPSFFSLGFFTHEGPTREQREQTAFEMTFFGKGYTGDQVGAADCEVVTSFTGTDPGYSGTAAIVFAAARTLIEEKKTIPIRGAVTPGMAFRNTSILHRLREAGVNFNIHTQPSAVSGSAQKKKE